MLISRVVRLPLVLLVLLAVLGAVGARRLERPPHPATHRAMKLLALGDSYTIGEGVGAADRWPVRLAHALRLRGIRASEPTIVARTGWTTDELDAGIDAAKPHGPFDLVTLLIGVNDQYRGRDVEGFGGRFDSLLARAIGFASGDAGRVIVVSIPDWGVTPFASDRDGAAIAAEIDAFNGVAHARAQARGTRWVDVTAISREPGHGAAWFTSDGLHPSADQYDRWVERILPEAAAALARRR
jgi:lysophospholipase L1-like esterase